MKPEKFIGIIQTIILLNYATNKQPEKNSEEVISGPNQQNIRTKLDSGIYINGKENN